MIKTTDNLTAFMTSTHFHMINLRDDTSLISIYLHGEDIGAITDMIKSFKDDTYYEALSKVKQSLTKSTIVEENSSNSQIIN